MSQPPPHTKPVVERGNPTPGYFEIAWLIFEAFIIITVIVLLGSDLNKLRNVVSDVSSTQSCTLLSLACKVPLRKIQQEEQPIVYCFLPCNR